MTAPASPPVAVGGDARVAERIRARVEYDTNGGCWLWPGRPVPGGYGHLWVEGGNTLVHRLSWATANGPIPDGAIVRHKCDVPACCNPEHLEIGSHAANMADCLARGRHRTARPPNLNNDQIAHLEGCISAGWSDRRVASELDVSRTTVSRRRAKMQQRHEQ